MSEWLSVTCITTPQRWRNTANLAGVLAFLLCTCGDAIPTLSTGKMDIRAILALATQLASGLKRRRREDDASSLLRHNQQPGLYRCADCRAQIGNSALTDFRIFPIISCALGKCPMIARAPHVPLFTNHPGKIMQFRQFPWKGQKHEQDVTQKFFECDWGCCGLCRNLTPQGRTNAVAHRPATL
jgi:hypothetical protein